MPFPIGRYRQRSVDKRYDLLRKFRRAAIADPLRIAPVGDQACRLKGGHVARHARLTGTEFAHQFANTMLAPIPHHSEGFEPGRLCESGENRNGIHKVTYITRLCAYPHIKDLRSVMQAPQRNHSQQPVFSPFACAC